jgi:ADP-heptose:LPS heptosyltransferase
MLIVAMVRKILIFLIDLCLCGVFPQRVWRKPRSQSDPKQILVCRTDHIGDVFLSIPAFNAIRAHFPKAQVVLLVASWANPVVEELDCYDEVWVCDPPWWAHRRNARFGLRESRGTWSELARMIWRIRHHQFDLCFDLRGDVRDLVAFGALGGARQLVSRSRNGGALLADWAPRIDEMKHEIDQNLELLAGFGVPLAPPRFGKFFAQRELPGICSLLESMRRREFSPVLLVHPGGKPINCWPERHYAALLERLSSEFEDLVVILTGGASEAPLCERLAEQLPGRAISLAGKLTLRETAACMASVDAVVMADTGPMHFLNAVVTPAILLFGPTLPVRFAPRRPGVRVVHGSACCADVLHERCRHSAVSEPGRCMETIEVSEVLVLIRESLVSR